MPLDEIDNSDYKVSKAEVLRILDECAQTAWNGKPFMIVSDYAKAIKEIEEL